MIAGIMQPYFFPYLGYFDHIFRCDKWVVLDITQYTPQSWMNRNRILHPAKSWRYITAAVNKTHEKQKIHEVSLVSPEKTCSDILRKLAHYRKKAPYFNAVQELVANAFGAAESASLVAVDVACMDAVCRYLDIPFEPVIASRQNYPLPDICHAGQWALEISGLLGADMYINPPGGRNLFRVEEFRRKNISLAFTRAMDFEYACPGYAFEPRLSVLDVMLWNSPEEIRAQLGKSSLDFTF